MTIETMGFIGGIVFLVAGIFLIKTGKWPFGIPIGIVGLIGLGYAVINFFKGLFAG